MRSSSYLVPDVLRLFCELARRGEERLAVGSRRLLATDVRDVHRVAQRHHLLVVELEREQVEALVLLIVLAASALLANDIHR